MNCTVYCVSDVEGLLSSRGGGGADILAPGLQGGDRFDPFGKFVNYHKAITIPPFGTR